MSDTIGSLAQKITSHEAHCVEHRERMDRQFLEMNDRITREMEKVGVEFIQLKKDIKSDMHSMSTTLMWGVGILISMLEVVIRLIPKLIN